MADNLEELDKAFEKAKKSIENNEFERALELFLWIDEKGNKDEITYHTVKLISYQHWGTFAAKYPKAEKEFKKVRDGKISQIKSGQYSWELFTDISWINRYLGEPHATIRLFEYLDQTNQKFAKQSYTTVEDDLIRFKKYRLARKYLGDPFSRLNEEIEKHNELIEIDESLRVELEPIFIDNIVNIVTILDKCHERNIASKIKIRALEISQMMKKYKIY
jgi:hypothetical protein